VTCDRAIFFRYMVHTLAEKHGVVATFMPKPFSHLTGNGCHFHMSLWNGETNVFLDDADPRGLGLSETAYQFVGGLKAHARAYSALTAPTVNSYKRLKVGTTASGATWSPVWVSYGYNNRTQMLRIPGAGRIEDRTIDGSCNPYLAAAAVLAAGLDGIEKGMDAGDPNSENLYTIPYDELVGRGLRTLPSNLLEATQELERDDVLREALGRGRDEDYVDYYVRVKRDEWNRYHEQVTPWEIREYLTRF
jgi:glutamine synthetase